MPVDRTPMTEEDASAARSLGSVTFLPGSADKRMARDMLARVEQSEPALSERERAYLWRLCYRYRRQIRDKGVVEEARRRETARLREVKAEW